MNYDPNQYNQTPNAAQPSQPQQQQPAQIPVQAPQQQSAAYYSAQPQQQPAAYASQPAATETPATVTPQNSSYPYSQSTQYPAAQYNGSTYSPKKKKFKGINPIALIAICLIVSFAGGFLGSLINSGSSITPITVSNPAENTWAQVVDEIYDSTVWFYVEGYDPGYGAVAWTGSGIIISPDGYILTNDHVAGDDIITDIKVILCNGDEYEATFVDADPNNDVALVKIDGSGFKYAKIADSDNVKVGDSVIAIGNPLGDNPDTVSNGIVSHLPREIEIGGRPGKQLCFQSTAAISSGNSGGGLFNYRGELIGLNNAVIQPYLIYDSDYPPYHGGIVQNAENIGFSVPINYAVDVIRDSIGDKYVPDASTLDMTLETINSGSAAKSKGYINGTGVYIEKVELYGAARFGGLMAGDRIISVNGNAVTTAEQANSIIEKAKLGQEIKLEIARGGLVYIYSIATTRNQ